LPVQVVPEAVAAVRASDSDEMSGIEQTSRIGKRILRTGLGILWLLGFSFHVGGGLIHLLLALGLIVLIFNFSSGRRYV
jgi:hypothetical protein